MSKDTISDILTCIRNADMANKETVRIGFTNIVEKIVQILLREGFIKKAREDRENQKTLLFFKEPQSDEDSEWDSDSESDIASTPPPDNTQNRGDTATKGGGPFGGGGGGGPSKKSTNGPKKQKDTKDRKNPKDTSLWKKLWDWLFG